jgi:hypothetical protein
LGKTEQIHLIEPLPSDVINGFPKLLADGGIKSSNATRQYNCLAWSAARIQKNWFEPQPTQAWEVWPKDVPNDYSLESFIILFEKLGYKRCSTTDISFEFFFKKVAIYADFGIYGQQQWEFTHVADQLHSGVWTSKLGPGIDIQHNTPNSLEGNTGEEYGRVYLILKKRCWPWDLLFRAFLEIRRFGRRRGRAV